MKLADLTPEDVCRKLMPTVWPSAIARDRERWLVEAQRYLSAIRSLVEVS